MAPPQLVVYPGTFDPFHRGHLEAVLAAAKTDLGTGAQLQTAVRVLIVLAADTSNPHKPRPAPAAHRAQLAQLAIAAAGAEGFVRVVVCEGATAVPDLRTLLETQAAAISIAPMNTALLCGDDVVERLPPASFFGQRVLVMKRSGAGCDDGPLSGLRAPRTCHWSEVCEIGVNTQPWSSTAVRWCSLRGAAQPPAQVPPVFFGGRPGGHPVQGTPNLPDLGQMALGDDAWAHIRQHGLYTQPDGGRPALPPEFRLWVAERVCVANEADAGGLSTFERQADDSWVERKPSGTHFDFGVGTWVVATNPLANCCCTPRAPCNCCAPPSEREDCVLLRSAGAGTDGDRGGISVRLTARAAFIDGDHNFYEGRWVVV